MLQRIEIQIEAVTPAFLHVEPQDEARWRAAPFRGLARWWFRAIGGAAWSLDEVRRREHQTFGKAEQASPVMFRITNPTGRSAPFDINPGSQRSAKRHALPPGSTATLILQANPWASNGTEALRQVYMALWVALHLGGIGQRCRRGAGSLRMRSVHFPPDWSGLPGVIDTPDRSKPAKDVAEDFARALGEGIAAARCELGVMLRSGMGNVAEWPVLHRQSAAVQVSWLEAFPSGSELPSEAARRALMNLRRQGAWHKSGRAEPEFGGIKPRLSSPLWLRIADVRRAENGKYRAFVVASLLRHAGAKGAQWSRVDEMLNSLKDRVEVTL